MQFLLFIILYSTAALIESPNQASVATATDSKLPLPQQPQAELINTSLTSSSLQDPSFLLDFNTTSQDPNDSIGTSDDDNDEDDDKDEEDGEDEPTANPALDTNFDLMYYITGASAALTFIGLSICLCYRNKIIEESGYTPVP